MREPAASSWYKYFYFTKTTKMSASIHLTIPQPCHENWHQMSADEQGRYCNACQKTVIDFTSMSDQEMLNHISKSTTPICGRLGDDQIDKELSLVVKRKFPSWLYTWNVFLAVSFGAVQSNGQSKYQNIDSASKQARLTSESFKIGKVISHTGEDKQAVIWQIVDRSTKYPVAYASVTIKKKHYSLAADASGRFMLTRAMVGKSAKVEISAIGYKQLDSNLHFSGTEQIIYMEPMVTEMKEVLIKVGATRRRTIYGGAIVMVRKDTILNKLAKECKEWIPFKNDIRIYPNPAFKGSMINIKLALKKTGNYALELLTADGMLMHKQHIVMEVKEKMVKLPLPGSFVPGIYWVRISGVGDGKTYQGKMVVL